MSPQSIKDYLLSTRMAKYPLATVVIVVTLLALLWWLMPDFVRWLGALFGAGIDQAPTAIDSGAGATG